MSKGDQIRRVLTSSADWSTDGVLAGQASLKEVGHWKGIFEVYLVSLHTPLLPFLPSRMWYGHLSFIKWYHDTLLLCHFKPTAMKPGNYMLKPLETMSPDNAFLWVFLSCPFQNHKNLSNTRKTFGIALLYLDIQKVNSIWKETFQLCSQFQIFPFHLIQLTMS